MHSADMILTDRDICDARCEDLYMLGVRHRQISGEILLG
jgi:hypothetical protein